MRPQPEPRICEQCGEPFGKKYKDSYPRFQRRRFCGKRCAGLGRGQRKPDEEFTSRYRRVMTPDGREMLEHRYVMEQIIGRPVADDEQVHHINHNGLDNRPANLELVTVPEHGLRHRVYPSTKPCAVCGETYAPHPDRRGSSQTCGKECASALKSQRMAEFHARRAAAT